MSEPLALCPYCGAPLIEHEPFSAFAPGVVVCPQQPQPEAHR